MNKYQMAKKMVELAQTLPASTRRAQAYNIAQKLKGLEEGDTIAQMMLDDHYSSAHALRHSSLLVDAGLATYTENERSGFYGSFEFIDGSILK